MNPVIVIIFILALLIPTSHAIVETDSPKTSESTLLDEIKDHRETQIKTLIQDLKTMEKHGPDRRKSLLKDLMNARRELRSVTLQIKNFKEGVSPLTVTDIASARDAIEGYQFPVAMAWLEKTIIDAHSPDRCAAILLLAKAHAARGNPEPAAETLLDTGNPRCSCQPHRLHLAVDYLRHPDSKQKSVETAIHHLETISSEFPDYVLINQVRADLAELYMLQSRWEKAVLVLRSLKENETTLRSTGKCLIETGQFVKAEKIFRKHWLHYPVSVDAVQIEQTFSDLCKRLGKPFPGESSKNLFKRIRRIDQAGDRDKARDLYRELLKTPLSAEIDAKCRLYLAKYLYDSRDNQAAIKEYDAFLKLYPRHNSVPTALLRKSIIFRRLKDDVQYLETVSQLIRKHTGSQRWLDGIIGRGEYRRSVNQLEKAEIDFNQAARRGSRDAFWKSAWVLYDMGKFEDAAAKFGSLAVKGKNSGWEPAALYWKGRCLDRTGKRNTAERIYEDLTQRFTRQYYGRCSQGRLHRNENYQLIPDGSGTDTLTSTGNCGDALYESGFLTRAALEFHRLSKSSKNQSRYYSKWEARALYQARNFKKARGIYMRLFEADLYQGNIPPEVMKILFPLPPDLKHEILKAANTHRLDPLFLASVILQESEFDSAALSRSFAVGYMQLTPKLFKRMTENRCPPPENHKRFDPSTNIDVGAAYLRLLLDTYNGSRPKTLAAYNAGEHRVDEWSRQYPDLDPEEWAEHIPFKQTRLYVKKILEYYSTYQSVYPDFR